MRIEDHMTVQRTAADDPFRQVAVKLKHAVGGINALAAIAQGIVRQNEY